MIELCKANEPRSTNGKLEIQAETVEQGQQQCKPQKIDADEGTIPTSLTSSSIANADVIVTANPVVTLISVSFSTKASIARLFHRGFGFLEKFGTLGATGAEYLNELYYTDPRRNRDSRPTLGYPVFPKNFGKAASAFPSLQDSL